MRMRTAVVLPAPFGPSSPSTVAVGTSRDTPHSASTSPKRFTRSSTRIAGAVIRPIYGAGGGQIAPSTLQARGAAWQPDRTRIGAGASGSRVESAGRPRSLAGHQVRGDRGVERVATRHRSRPGLSDTRHRAPRETRRRPDGDATPPIARPPAPGTARRPSGPRDRRTASTAQPASRNRRSSGIPRSDPGPTVPGPASWKIDFGCSPVARRTACSVARNSSASGGRRVPRGPKKGGGQSRSQSSAQRAASDHPSLARDRSRARGRTIRGSRTRSRDRPSSVPSAPNPSSRSTVSSRVRPALRSVKVAPSTWRSRCGGAAPVRRGRRTSRPRRSALRRRSPRPVRARSAARSARSR